MRARPSSDRTAERLASAIDEALALLSELPQAAVKTQVPVAERPPASLLDECLDLCARHEAKPAEPIRTIHQFACTGGTLISKCLAAMPNVQLLSEVDPLSELVGGPKPRFAPTDLITLARQSTRGIPPEVLREIFLSGIRTIYADATARGLYLVLRDHSHSQFCVGNAVPERPGLRAIVASAFPVKSVITVRHPRDSYLSLKANGWVHFRPQTFEEYCIRYLSFLDAHAGLPIYRYEDFVDAPARVMAEICGQLALPYIEDFDSVFSVFNLTGDSGRRGGVIGRRSPRPADPEIEADIAASTSYHLLLQRLGYE